MGLASLPVRAFGHFHSIFVCAQRDSKANRLRKVKNAPVDVRLTCPCCRPALEKNNSEASKGAARVSKKNKSDNKR